MADEKVNASPEEKKAPEAPAPSGPGEPSAPEHTEGPAVPDGDQAAPAHAEPAAGEHTQQTVLPGMGEDAPAPSGKVINLSDIQAADKGGKEASAPAPEKKAPEADKPPKRRSPAQAARLRLTRRPVRMLRPLFGTKCPEVRKPTRARKRAPEVPPRPVEEGKIVYLKMSELHPFHTFREHPYKVQDDKAMDDLVGTIKEHGIMTPATVRPEKNGKGYEIIAGHRRHHGGARVGLEEMPCIVREMTDLEAVREMRNSNKQRGDPLPSELAKLLDLEVEAIKRQGARPKTEKEAEALGKLSVEIVGKEHDMNYKKVMRYIRLNSLVPELLDKVDAKQMGFMPAVEISYIRPENQRLIAVSIDGEQSSPSVAQAKRLHELDKEGKLNGDVIDGILSEEKKEDRGVIISTAELSKYFGKEVTPAKMKEQIMALLDEWKEKQPPELAKPDKKKDLEK